MKSLLQTLHDNESILLLYLFEELPADDRAEVEAMLSADADLRSQLSDLKQTYEQVTAKLEESDAANAAGLSHATAKRQAAKAIDQWNTRRILAPRPQPIVQATGRKWLAYSSGIAATILAACLIYRGVSNDTPKTVTIKYWPAKAWTSQEREVFDLFPPLGTDGSSDLAVALAPTVDDSEMLRKSLDPSEELLNDSLKHVDLNAAEREIGAVAQLSDHSAISGGLSFE